MRDKAEVLFLLIYLGVICLVYFSDTANISKHLGFSLFYLFDLISVAVVAYYAVVRRNTKSAIPQIFMYIGIFSLFRTIVLWGQQQSYIFLLLDFISLVLLYDLGRGLRLKKRIA